MTGWEPSADDFPWPPANAQVFSSMFIGAVDIRWDDPSTLSTGSSHTVTEAGATITVDGTPATQTQAAATIIITDSNLDPGTVVEIGGVEIVGVVGAPGADEFRVDASADDIATSLTQAINDGSVGGFGVATATVDGNVLTLTAVTAGSVGNDITLSCTSPSVLVSSSTFADGLDGDTVTVGNVTLTAVLGDAGVGEFTVGATDFDTATSIATALNDPENRASFVRATSGGGSVYLNARIAGSDGNMIVLTTTSEVLTLSSSTLDGGAGNPNSCRGKSNAKWNIVGVNIYRSDNGERGPYLRVNKFPIGSMAWRDLTDNVLIENEVVRWDGSWISRGESANDRRWTFKTTFHPVVKAAEPKIGEANASLTSINANSPGDVTVKIDGVVVPVAEVFGKTGEITLVNQSSWDPAREKVVDPKLPKADGTSEVVITYRWGRNVVLSKLDRTTQVFYRLTTVALDPTSPSGYAETPLGYSPPVSVSQVESLDYIWREAARMNLWILQQAGEWVKLFKMKVSGVPCLCTMDERTLDFGKQASNRCLYCFGVGWVGGYDGPFDILIAPEEADRRVAQTPNGRKLEHSYEVWTGINPAITQRDFVVKQTNERYSIGPTRRPTIRGRPLQQHFNVAYFSEQDIRYRVPVNGISDLPWPQTRNAGPTPCNPSDPYPTGPTAVMPMETEKSNIPDGREQRGRTPVYGNITY